MQYLIGLIFVSHLVFANNHDFTVRDSQTGRALEVNVLIQRIDKDKLSEQQWQHIKLGDKVTGDITLFSVFSLYPEDNKYRLEDSQFLQILTLSDENYKQMQTFIEPNSTVMLNSIMLDKIIENSKKEQGCQNTGVCGYIYDKLDLRPLAGVKLSLSTNQNQYFSQTDSQGRFTFANELFDYSELVINYPGYKTQIWTDIPEKTVANMIIDLDKGNGVYEKSMEHPLVDVLNNQIDNDWLQVKLNQDQTENSIDIKERSTGAIYLQPPASIRVGFNDFGGSCCAANCSTNQVYSLETYVQRGLDNEWIASWRLDSLKAGSITYRSYGAWHVLHDVYNGYDICAGPCCQAFEVTAFSASINAAKATNGIMLDQNGEVARSEYSAQNNSWDDPNDGLNCSNNDLSCGDGSVGSPATGWPCLVDKVAIGRGCFGHGRGMSQWGTQFHAIENKSFADIIDHYYNASDNPSGQRSQYGTAPIRLDVITIDTSTVSTGEVFSIDYEVFNSSDATIPFGPLLLGASLVNGNGSYSDPFNDFPVMINQSSVVHLQRPFQVPAMTPPGVYDLAASVYLDVNADNNIAAADWKLMVLTLSAAITVLSDNDLIFKSSF